MNKFFFTLILTLVFVFSCGRDTQKQFGPYSVTILYINETSDSVTQEPCSIKKMAPKDTFIFSLDNFFTHMKVNADNFPFDYIFGKHSCPFKYGSGNINILKCDSSSYRDITNYENRKEVAPLVFEFTFRFTEEKKANAEPCN